MMSLVTRKRAGTVLASRVLVVCGPCVDKNKGRVYGEVGRPGMT